MPPGPTPGRGPTRRPTEVPLAFFRLGLFTWSQRRSISRGVLVIASAVLVVPVLLALLVTTAVANLPLPTGAPAKSMASWQVSQLFGCTGFVFEPRNGDCAHFHSGIDLVGPVGAPCIRSCQGWLRFRPHPGTAGGTAIMSWSTMTAPP